MSETKPNPASGVEDNPPKVTIYIGSTVEDEGWSEMSRRVLIHILDDPDIRHIKVIKPEAYWTDEYDIKKAKDISPLWLVFEYYHPSTENNPVDWTEYVLVPIKTNKGG